MQGTSASPERLNAQQRSAHSREVVLARGVELRKGYPILNHQDAPGVGILPTGASPLATGSVLIRLKWRLTDPESYRSL